MCGIAGIVNTDGRPADARILADMIAMLGHRGPDASGVFTDGEAGFSHARLSIIDVAGGAQPMSNAERSLWITFNGEIFNYVELREELLRKGHQFATRSDTEVLLHLYAEEGPDCVRKLNGQWAFAIWDCKTRRLFLSRDRLGVRPVFYTQRNGAFLFASEVKALFAHPAVERRLDSTALSQVFTYWFTLPPRTIFEGVRELPPGHSLILQDGKSEIRRYWQLDFHPDPEGARREQEYVDELWELLVDATRLRLRADVPVGTYLSGGLDSSLVTAIVKRFTNTPVRSFSVGFEDPEFDESRYQDEVIEHLGTDHQRIHCTYQDIGRVFPEVIWHTEKPILRTAPAPLFILSKLVREGGYKVVVTGEGADEMLGGYDIFKEAKIRSFWGARPESRLRPLLLRRLYPYLHNVQNQSDAYLRAFFRVNAGDMASPFFSHLPRWELTSKLKLFFGDALRTATAAYDPYADLATMLPAQYGSWPRLCQAQYLEALYLLPGYILSSQGDRVALAHSVEIRLPFLDHRVVEFASRIPPALKMKVLNEKYILKRCVGDLLPPSVRRRHKQPYRAPDGKSFFHAAAPDYVRHLLSADHIRENGLFNPVAVQKLTDKFADGRAIGTKDNMALVGILSAQVVVDRFIRGFQKQVPKEDHAVSRTAATPVRS
ncbi:MAG: asparagine synthase (glutamine-hydrolyzing) [Acidobacteriia bacterium]|nr:asparagine synthase (glutamine-hydrolyzing) [Terriglobia bacterium]